MLYENISLSLNGQEDEIAAIREAMRIVSATQAKLTIIHINDPAAGKAHMMMDTLPLVTEKELAALVGKAGFGSRLKDVTFRMIESENYADAIAEASSHADLLIMGHHPKSRFAAFFREGTDEHVADMRYCCPILLVPLKC